MLHHLVNIVAHLAGLLTAAVRVAWCAAVVGVRAARFHVRQFSLNRKRRST
jgi:hypothetical protein